MTSGPLPAPRTARALEVRKQRSEASLKRIKDALEHMLKSKAPITVAAAARQADVSRTFLYEHAEARSLVAEAMDRAAGRRVQARQEQQDALEASWRERALNAEDALKITQQEILSQRRQIAELLGQVRDLQSEWTEEDIVRITTENSGLKRRVRELTGENRSLDSRLTAARDNGRFADRRIADLEVRLAEETV